MAGTEYKRGIYLAFQHAGFAKKIYALRVPGEGVTTLVNTQKGFGAQWFINVGFCLHRLDPTPVELVEKTHMYFRLERLFPAHRELILSASEIDDPEQPAAYLLPLDLLAGQIGAGLRALASEQGIIEAYRAGRLHQGLVLGAARVLIEASA
jgi:hypothetical protein